MIDLLAQATPEPVRVTVESGGGGGNIALIVSVVSAFFAGIALALTLRREIRDRAILYVTADPTVEPNGKGRVVCLVENRGRQPVTVAGIGLKWDIESPPPGIDGSGQLLVNNPWDRTRLEPGGHAQVWWEPPSSPTHLDTPMRPFAEAGGSRVYGKPTAYLRHLTIMGWQPERPVAPEHSTPPAVPLRAKRVVGRWKLWKPKHLRRATPAWTPDMTPERLAEIVRELEQGERQEPGPN